MVSNSSVVGTNSVAGMRITHATNQLIGEGWATGNWVIYETHSEMSSFGLFIDRCFGFDVQINGDGNGGVRDSRWAWWGPSGDDFRLVESLPVWTGNSGDG